MRRFWPLFAAVLCWLVILAVPVTRQGVVTAWRQYRQPTREETFQRVSAGPFSSVSVRTAAMIKRYPNDKAVLIYAATYDTDIFMAKDLKRLTALYPQDATILAVHLIKSTVSLRGWRDPGAVKIPGFSYQTTVDPPSAALRAKWDDVIASARRGTQLEPNNTFFDWMLLYALYSTNRDDEARQVLSRASQKTVYDNHERDVALSALTFLRLADGSPVSPFDLIQLRTTSRTFNGYYKFTQTAQMVMEKAIANRQNGAHDQSMQTALDLLKLSRVLRREGYTISDSLAGASCEKTALTGPYLLPQALFSAAPSPPTTLARRNSRPISLASYAAELGRKDLASSLDAQWALVTKWNGSIGTYVRSGTADYAEKPLATIIFIERLRVLILRILPSILLMGVIFWLLSRRFRDGLAAPAGWRKGAAFGVFLLLGALALDAATTFSEQQYFYLEMGYRYALGENLLKKSPSWFTWGLAGAMLCFGWHGAVVWQQQRRGQKTFKGQLKALFEPSEDGLAAFDFGWLFGWVARLTFWIILLWSLLALSMHIRPGDTEIVWLAPVVIVGASLGAHLSAWRHGTHRRQALKLSHRLIAESMGGFFVLVSVLYAVTSFAILPTALQFERDFESALQPGELKIARGKLGLK